MDRLRNVRTLWSVLALLSALTACSESDTSQSMGKVMGGESGGYSQVEEGMPLVFPRDHLAHDGFRQEWWYLTANLTADSGETLGIQWTQFRIAMSSEDKIPDGKSSWQTNQLYMAHSAVTGPQLHLADEKWSRAHKEFAGVTDSPFSVKIDNWIWLADGDELFPATLSVETDAFSYRLRLTSESPLQLQGNDGYSLKSADATLSSYYYSQPFIKVEGEVYFDEQSSDTQAQGGEALKGQAQKGQAQKGQALKVTGSGWLDREWSSQFLTDSQQGWDWFALRLDDGSALMLFQLRGGADKEGSYYSGRRMYPDGQGRHINTEDIRMKPLKHEKINGRPYPVSWSISVPSEEIELTVTAVNPDSLMPLSIGYWEGPVDLTGSHSGMGYMELTGY